MRESSESDERDVRGNRVCDVLTSIHRCHVSDSQSRMQCITSSELRMSLHSRFVFLQKHTQFTALRNNQRRNESTSSSEKTKHIRNEHRCIIHFTAFRSHLFMIISRCVLPLSAHTRTHLIPCNCPIKFQRKDISSIPSRVSHDRIGTPLDEIHCRYLSHLPSLISAVCPTISLSDNLQSCEADVSPEIPPHPPRGFAG